ncbi:MAG: hypothetical protein V3V20_11530 [Algisphaera sp.]
MPEPTTSLTLHPPADFDLTRAVCSYGYFTLAPNHWDATKHVLHRPLRTTLGQVVKTTLEHRENGTLRLVCDRMVPRSDHATLKAQVRRMLRLDESFTAWHTLHSAAQQAGFGRLFRSPTLFEDVIKTFTSCNVTWANTQQMNRLMVENVGHGGFPTPTQLADFGEARLKTTCRVGYRASRIVELARDIEKGDVGLDWFEKPGHASEVLFEAFHGLYGVGPYAAGNLCHLVGVYDRLAIDTEMVRHFCKKKNIKRPQGNDAARLKRLHQKIERYYAAFKPYQFIAYWFELWETK